MVWGTEFIKEDKEELAAVLAAMVVLASSSKVSFFHVVSAPSTPTPQHPAALQLSYAISLSQHALSSS